MVQCAYGCGMMEILEASLMKYSDVPKIEALLECPQCGCTSLDDFILEKK